MQRRTGHAFPLSEQGEDGAMPRLHARIMRRLRNGEIPVTDRHGTIDGGDGYTIYLNDDAEPWAPIVGTVVDSGCAVLVRDGFPSAIFGPGGACTLSATEPIETTIERILSKGGTL